jgi:hypothetical protein
MLLLDRCLLFASSRQRRIGFMEYLAFKGLSLPSTRRSGERAGAVHETVQFQLSSSLRHCSSSVRYILVINSQIVFASHRFTSDDLEAEVVFATLPARY